MNASFCISKACSSALVISSLPILLIGVVTTIMFGLIHITKQWNMKNNKYRYSNLDLNSSGWRSLTTWILENNGGTSNEIWKIYIKWMINQLFLSKWVKFNNNFDVKIIRQPFRSDCEPKCWSVTFVYALSHIYFQINVHLILMKNSCFFSKANRICKHDKMTLIYETNTHDRKAKSKSHQNYY